MKNGSQYALTELILGKTEIYKKIKSFSIVLQIAGSQPT